MRNPVVDELEERRIVRRLAQLAEAVEPLPDHELNAILSGAAARVPALRRSRPYRPIRLRLPSVAVAAAAALAIAVGIGQSERSPHDPQVRRTTPGQLLSFPEGSALALLLYRAGAERPA